MTTKWVLIVSSVLLVGVVDSSSTICGAFKRTAAGKYEIQEFEGSPKSVLSVEHPSSQLRQLFGKKPKIMKLVKAPKKYRPFRLISVGQVCADALGIPMGERFPHCGVLAILGHKDNPKNVIAVMIDKFGVADTAIGRFRRLPLKLSDNKAKVALPMNLDPTTGKTTSYYYLVLPQGMLAVDFCTSDTLAEMIEYAEGNLGTFQIRSDNCQEFSSRFVTQFSRTVAPRYQTAKKAHKSALKAAGVPVKEWKATGILEIDLDMECADSDSETQSDSDSSGSRSTSGSLSRSGSSSGLDARRGQSSSSDRTEPAPRRRQRRASSSSGSRSHSRSRSDSF